MILMGVVLYPYVYLLARAAFLEQSVNVLEVSRVLGRGSWHTFYSISLPAARPAVAVGVALALMETLNDYGTVDFFAVRTMTAGLIDVWLGMGSLAGGAQIATTMLVFVIALITLERISRRHQKVYQQSSTRFRALPAYHLTGWRAFAAGGLCAIPVTVGFVIPVAVLSYLAVLYFEDSWTSEFRTYALNSLTLSSIAALLALGVALFIAYSRRLGGGRLLGVAARVASLGYAMPGAVLAVGTVVPFAAFDNSVDAFLRAHLGISSGLLLSGTVVAVLFAYVVRFLAVALGQIESSLEKVSPSMDMAARTLGYRAGQTLLRYHVPLIRGGMLTAVMIVFVDCMKELPATLLLRPFNFETLATHVYQFASDEMLGEAALGSLTIVVVGLIPVLVLSWMISRSRVTPGNRVEQD
jgi:iron(III) transport system permease protein